MTNDKVKLLSDFLYWNLPFRDKFELIVKDKKLWESILYFLRAKGKRYKEQLQAGTYPFMGETIREFSAAGRDVGKSRVFIGRKNKTTEEIFEEALNTEHADWFVSADEVSFIPNRGRIYRKIDTEYWSKRNKRIGKNRKNRGGQLDGRI